MIVRFLLAGMLMFAIAAPAFAATKDDGNAMSNEVAASFARDGDKYLEAGRAMDAVRAFKIALNFDPNLAEAKAGLERAKAFKATAKSPAKVAAKATSPSTDNMVRAQATIRRTCVDARAALDKADWRTAATLYRRALDGAKPLAKRAKLDDVIAEARAGIARAEAALRQTGGVAKTTSRAPGVEARGKIDEANRRAFAAAMAGVRDMAARPPSRILTRIERTPLESRRRRSKDFTTTTITRNDFSSTVDEEEVQLIESKLVKKVSIRFTDETFVQAVDYIRQASGVNIMIDPAVIPTTTSVRNFVVSNMSLRHVLNHLMRYQKGLGYCIRDGAILISNSAGLADKPVMTLHYIADLTVRIKNHTQEMASSGLLRDPLEDRAEMFRASGRGRDDVAAVEREREGENWAKFIRKNVEPGTWGDSDANAVGANTIAYRNGKLVVTHAPEVQDQIRDLLASFRKARAIQVAILSRFIEVNEDFLDEVGVNLSIDNGSTTRNRFFSLSTQNDPEVGLSTFGHQQTGGATINASFLGTTDVTAIITAVRKERKGNILTAPRVTCFNTQRAFLTVTTRRNFVRSYDADGNPEIGQVNDGIIFEVQPFVSADRRYITLELIPQVNIAGELQEFAFQRDSTNGGNLGSDGLDNDGDGEIDEADENELDQQKIQLPQITTRQVMTTVSVPDGGTLMIGGLAQAKEAEGYATTPFFGDLPLIGHLFRSRRKVDSRNNLIVLVTAHIIEQEEDQ
jgi:type II/III secretion system protein